MIMSENKLQIIPWFFIIIVTIIPLLLLSCSGKETFGLDTTPPAPVNLIPHLGDTGDLIYVGGVLVNDENNGIDTVPDNNWLRIQWYTVQDPDLDYIKIFRFGDYSQETFIDSLSRTQVNHNQYLDSSLHLVNPVGQTWYYYVKGFDIHGNFSVSDTVSYKLLSKPVLLTPADFAEVHPDSLSFQWLKTNDALHYRVLIFDDENNYIWHEDYHIDENSEEILFMEYRGPNLANDMIIWRVDTLDDIIYDLDPHGISMSGAESLERIVYISP